MNWKQNSVLILVILITGCANTRTAPAPIVNVTNIPQYIKAVDHVNHLTISKTTNNKTASKTTIGALPRHNAHTITQKVGSTSSLRVNHRSPVTPGVVGKSESYTTSQDTLIVRHHKLVKQKASMVVTLSPVVNMVWAMPTKGKYSAYKQLSRGINIYGHVGQPIYAVNNGKVVYSGNALKGYGNLIIIKHDTMYLSAYALNKTNLVQEGDIVRRGQQIATMGLGANKVPTLHFEIRQNGKPIDPMLLLKQ